MAALLVTVTACDDESGSEQLSGLVTGEWVSDYSDGFYFDTLNKMFYKGYDSNRDGVIDWNTESDTTGTIEDHSDYDEASGYLVIKVVLDSYSTYGVGTYTVVRWKECDGSSVKESIAAKYTSSFLPDGPQSYDTVEGAVENLTEENGYFSFYGLYNKK